MMLGCSSNAVLSRYRYRYRWLAAVLVAWLLCGPRAIAGDDAAPVRRLLYVAAPGIRNLLEYGGHGLLVFDIDDQHRFIKRIPIGGLGADGKPLNIKGIAANAGTDRIYLTTPQSMMCLDLRTEKLLWERKYDGGCDRLALSPDGATIYVPSFEKDHWHIVNAESGDVLGRVEPKSGAHNTIYGPDGKSVYLAGLRSPILSVADTSTHTIAKTVGPFSASIRPFTINGKQTLVFVTLNELLGFEIGDLTTGRRLHRVEVPGFQRGPVLRHGCPSHGIGMTPDEKEIWVVDAANKRVHIFDATLMPPVVITSIALRDEPGWVAFSIDGRLAYPSTGDVINVANHEIVEQLTDETGAQVESEKLLEIDFRGADPVVAGHQFGIGRRTAN